MSESIHRICSYVRVSSEEQVRGFSLDAQRRAIRDECARRGLQVVAEFADEGKSAKSDTLAKRPGFRAALSAVTSGAADAVMVHNSDRAARNLLILLTVLRELDGRLIAVADDFDYATPEGKLRAHIMGSVAQWYSDKLAQEVKKGKRERARAGLWNGRLPFGTCKQAGDEAGRLPPVPDVAPVLSSLADGRTWSRYDALLHLFSSCAAGHSLPEIVADLHALGFHLGLGTVYELTTNRFFVGEIPVRDPATGRRSWLPGVHPPLVDPGLFERANAARVARRSGPAKVRKAARVYPLTGLCRCARCGAAMHARPDPAGSGRLICATRYTRHACDQPSTGMAPIEEAAVLFLARYAPPLQLARFVAEQLAGERRDGRRERAALEQRLRRLRELYLWGDLGADEYRAKRRDLEMQLAGLGASAPDRRTTEQLIRYLRDLAAGYRDAEDRERNELLRVVFRAIEVEASAVTTVELRPPFDGILAAAMVDTFGSSGTAETVPLATPLGGGRFAIPPLPIARHQREKIPAAAWPVILEAYRSGQRAPELAAIYGVVESTIWKVLRKARAAEDAV